MGWQLPTAVQWGLVAIGAVIVFDRVLRGLQFVAEVFLLSGTNLGKYGKPGTWAVVTGASDGIGKEYARQLAAHGFNLILVSRTESKLATLAQELQTASGGPNKVQVTTLAMDYARDDPADYQRLRQLVDDVDVGVLINNVGQSHSIPVPFADGDADEVRRIVTINCLGTLQTTQAVLPGMRRRRRGLVLTMGSFAGWMPTPYLATYSGTKAFLQFWSTSLAEEVRADGVDVHLVLTYLITTAMSKIRRTSLLIPSPAAFVRSALAKIGNGHFVATPHTYVPWWSHALLLWAVESTVGAVHQAALWVNFKMHKDIRTRALRKAAREAKAQ